MIVGLFFFLFLLIGSKSFSLGDKDYNEIFDGISNISLNLEEVE